MRRASLFIVLMLFLFPLAVSAQDDENTLIFDLSETFTVTDLNFDFPYPADWVFDASDGITLAATEEDIAAEIDDDPTTVAQDYTIKLTAFPLEAMEMTDASLDEIVTFLVDSAGITVSEQVEVPVMTRRSITVIGVDSNNEAGLASFWLQDGYVVIFSLGTPEETVSNDTAYSWGIIIGSASSIPAEGYELTETIELPELGVSLNYPTGWTAVTDESSVRFFETEEDAANDAQNIAPENYAMAFFFTSAAGIGITEDVTYEDLPTIAQVFFEPEQIFSVDEHVILDIPGILLIGASETQATATGLFANQESDTALVVLVSAPDPEALGAFQPTGIAILQSLRLLEE